MVWSFVKVLNITIHQTKTEIFEFFMYLSQRKRDYFHFILSTISLEYMVQCIQECTK